MDTPEASRARTRLTIWRAGLAIFCAGALLLLWRHIDGTMPYPYHADEGFISGPASNVLVKGDLHPPRFNYPSLPTYLAAGAIHGCCLCEADRPLVYMEDVGRHNAIDKIAGYMRLKGISAADKLFYTTGRLTSEMVIKTVQMGIPILISRSGFTAWGVELARKADLTLIGRAKGKRFVALAGAERIVFDADPHYVPEESRKFQRKASLEDDAA